MKTNNELKLSQILEHTKISFTYKDTRLFGRVWNKNKDYFFAYIDNVLNPEFFNYKYTHMFVSECDVKDIIIL